MKLIVLFTFTLLSLSAKAQVLSDEFSSGLRRFGITNVNEQAYCYSRNGVTEGFRAEKLQRIASVTKLISTLMASDTMNLKGVFTTKFYIADESLHIEGGIDPYFEEEKILLLFDALNKLNYTSFKRITFSEKFYFYDVALGEYEKITPAKIRERLAYYTNPSNKSFVTSKWNTVRKFAAEEGVVLSKSVPFIKSLSVAVSNTNPLAGANPQVLVHKSLPFHLILKSMNVQSKNYVAENVYQTALFYKSTDAILAAYGIPAETYRIYNGSGLPMINGESRLDNLATCDTLLKIFESLSESLRKHGLEISDVVAVNGGKDLGSFRERFLNYPGLKESVISKTGTLKHTSSLAGFLLIGNEVPFAILNHTTSTSTAKKFQDYFVSRLFAHIGRPTPIPYQKISIFPWANKPFFLP